MSLCSKDWINTYQYFSMIQECYNNLYDDLSKKIFNARLNFDLTGNFDAYCSLLEASGLTTTEEIKKQYLWIEQLRNTQTPIYLYGAGRLGIQWYQLLKEEKLNILGVVDKNFEHINKNKLHPCTRKNNCNIQGDGVISPQQLIERYQGEYIIICTYSNIEICSWLKNNLFPLERVIIVFQNIKVEEEKVYFDFFDRIKSNGAFIDAGAFDCHTSLNFIKHCNGNYSEIIAFEPDLINYKVCEQIVRENSIKNIQLFNCGLGQKEETKYFDNLGTSASRIIENGTEEIAVKRIDDIVKDKLISFIKMDIEGWELEALLGAEDTIRKNKPMLAISAYHKLGDILSLLAYIHQIVPEYNFALRQYANITNETIIYAFL